MPLNKIHKKNLQKLKKEKLASALRANLYNRKRQKQLRQKKS
ncbi:MAG: hypothetical protein ACR2NY_03550 [Alphaproteobacteria bacterium]